MDFINLEKKMKKNCKIDAGKLREEIVFSLERVERLGQHSDKLGVMLMTLSDIVVATYKVSMANHIVEDLKFEVVCEMIVSINRLNKEKIDAIDDMYNYLYQIGIRKLIKMVVAIRNWNASLAELEDIIRNSNDFILDNSTIDKIFEND